MASSFTSLDLTLNALHTYNDAKLQEFPKGRVLLKLDKEGGQKILKAVSEDEMTYLDRFKAFFGISSFNLFRVVSFMQNELCGQLDNTPLAQDQIDELHQVTHFLDDSIDKHNGRFFLFRKTITTTKPTLEMTVTEHCRLTAVQSKTQEIAESLLGTREPLDETDSFDQSFEEKLSTTQEIAESPIEIRTPLDEAQSFVRSFEEKLIQAVKEGKLNFTEDGDFDRKIVDPTFDGKWRNVAQTLQPAEQATVGRMLSCAINRAIIEQEIARLEKKIAEAPKFVEEALLQKYCEHQKRSYPARTEVCVAQADALRDYLEQNVDLLGKMIPKDVKQQIDSIKQQAVLSLCGIAVADCQRMQEMIKVLEDAWLALSVYKENLTQKLLSYRVVSGFLPSITRDWWIARVGEGIQIRAEKIINAALEKNIEKISNPDTTPEMLKRDLDNKEKDFHRECDYSIAHYDQLLQDTIEFYKKWKPFLKAEMKQGFYDPGEHLGEGVCDALSLRWLASELKKTDLMDAEELIKELKIGEISKRDRMVQAKGDIMFMQRKLAQAEDWRTVIPPLVGLEMTAKYDYGHLKGKEEIVKAIKELCRNDDFRIVNQGVGELVVDWGISSSHAIALSFHRDESNIDNCYYRVSDPNYGTFHFAPRQNDSSYASAENMFFDFLSDLFLRYDSEIDLSAEAYKLKEQSSKA